MIRAFSAALLSLAVLSTSSFAQDGPLRRAGRALDATGKNIRARVETEVARGQITAQERDVLNRVLKRIEWDKQFVGSALQLESRAGGVVVLRGSVIDVAAKQRAVDLAQSTLGVTSVVDELAVVKEVKVIQANPVDPAPRVIESTPTVPAETKIIVKP